MITASIYFDTRRANKNGTYPLRLNISKNGGRACMVLGINLFPDQWKDDQVVNHDNARVLNIAIRDKLTQVDKYLLEKESTGHFANKTAKEVLLEVRAHIDPDFAEKLAVEEKQKQEEANSFPKFFQSFIATKQNAGTRKLYQETYTKLELYCEDKGIEFDSLSFDDITKSFLLSFEQFCLTTQKQNTASRHLRDIRAVFNAAIDEGKTTSYPFRRLSIKREESRDKSHTACDLRKLFSYNCYPGREQEAVDMFKLMFCLRGINCGDLANLMHTDIRGGSNRIRPKENP